MKTKKLKSGSKVLDKFLDGGFESDVITTFYGPAGSGKTLVVMLAATEAVKAGKKVIYIDTEGGFSVERLSQIDDDYELILKHITFLRPTSFEEQKKVFEKLRDIISKEIGIIIVDSIAMLYRIELGKSDQVYITNKELGLQLSYLSEIARKKNIPIIVTNQVYADFEVKDNVKMVGGDLLKYGSKCLIELKREDDTRKMVLVKHRSIKEGKEVEFTIEKKGIEKSIPQ
ncbi:DNA repair and recombination protein RadB [Candidatus Woesearchaeota archaeon]|nr:DNA repair and recombination protein RadB [Candidatus Woesearchaeota archaeon]